MFVENKTTQNEQAAEYVSASIPSKSSRTSSAGVWESNRIVSLASMLPSLVPEIVSAPSMIFLIITISIVAISAITQCAALNCSVAYVVQHTC